MTVNFAVGFAIGAITLLLLWAVKGLMLTPVKCGKNTSMHISIDVDGAEDGLEHTIKALAWLRDNGTLKADIHLSVRNADELTSHVARTYAADCGYITLSEDGEIYGRAN